MINIYDKIAELRKNNIKAVLCTVVSTIGSTPGKIGFKMLVMENYEIFGTVGGGLLEKTVIDKAIITLKTTQPELFKCNLTTYFGMKCGGTMEIYLEPIFNNNKLFIFGAGHIGKALAQFTKNLDFQTYVIDERENIFFDWNIKDAPFGFNQGTIQEQELNKLPFQSLADKNFCSCTTINRKYSEFLADNPPDNSTFIVIVTKGHDSDVEILKLCIRKPFAYLGVIGSRRKAEAVKKELIDENFASEDEFLKVDIPMGLDIAATGPYEIAISIVSKLILVKNRK